MRIYDPDPVARASRISDALTIMADVFRWQGAAVDVVESRGRDIRIVAMTVNLPCALTTAMNVSTALKSYANESGGEIQDNPFGADISGINEVQYTAALVYAVVKTPARRRRAA